jgi:tetratricopeptide (TPR) repeat protein
MLRGVGLALLVVTLLGTSASADDSREEAKAHFELARVQYRAGKTRLALEEFRKAYKIAPVPALLYNIALCQEQLGQLSEALESYRAFRATRGEEDHAELDAHIQELERRRVSPPPTVDAEEALRTAPIHKTPVYKKWWLWTTVGIVVAGGVAAGVVLGLRATTAPHPTFPGGEPQ